MDLVWSSISANDISCITELTYLVYYLANYLHAQATEKMKQIKEPALCIDMCLSHASILTFEYSLPLPNDPLHPEFSIQNLAFHLFR